MKKTCGYLVTIAVVGFILIIGLTALIAPELFDAYGEALRLLGII